MEIQKERILIKPVLSEKTTALRDLQQYTFQVDARATKPQIMSAVDQLFGVHSISCNIINVDGKVKRVRGRAGRESAWKKAIVRIKKGESIKIFEGA